MKVLFLLPQDLDSPSGLGRYWPLARELVRLGHTVTIAALHPSYATLSDKSFIKEGVKICYVSPMHVRKHGNVKSYYSAPALLWVALRATLSLSWSAISISADIIHIGKPQPMNGIAGILGKYLRGRQVYLDCDDYETEVNRYGAQWQKKVIVFFERWLPRRVQCITTHTHFISSRLQAEGIPPERIFYLSNGVDHQRFTPPDPQKVDGLCTNLGLVGKKVIAYIGSLSSTGHPVDLLLRAFVAIKKALPESVLLLVGGGEDYEKLYLQAQTLGIGNSTIFCGRISPEDVSLYYHISDVSVDPVYDNDSARGRSPLKMFESWACGVPFVTADVGDRNFLIGDPPAGLLAEPGDPDSLAKAILSILQNPGLADSLRTCGLHRIENYSWDKLAKQLEAIYLSNPNGDSRRT